MRKLEQYGLFSWFDRCKNIANTCTNSRWISIVSFTSRVTSTLFFTAFLALPQSQAKVAPSQWPEMPLNQVNFNVSGPLVLSSGALAVNEQSGAHGRDGGVELLPLVAHDGDAVSNNQPHKEGQGVLKNRIDPSDEFKDWIQVLASPVLWLLFGLFCGGAFERRRRY